MGMRFIVNRVMLGRFGVVGGRFWQGRRVMGVGGVKIARAVNFSLGRRIVGFVVGTRVSIQEEIVVLAILLGWDKVELRCVQQ